MIQGEGGFNVGCREFFVAQAEFFCFKAGLPHTQDSSKLLKFSKLLRSPRSCWENLIFDYIINFYGFGDFQKNTFFDAP